ncbi:MAG: hypothetical protein WEB33_10235 [Bacteroidota bacterium]
MKEIKHDIVSRAPEPGKLVLIHALEISRPASTFNSVVLSAMDVNTHLQLGRMYFVSSLAATIDFLHFLAKVFPFPIEEIRTDDHPLFASESNRQLEHRFTLAAHQVGIKHSIRDVHDTSVESLLRWYFFHDGRNELSGTSADEKTLPAELEKFLFFHNHHRSLPTIGGKTPIEELRRHKAYKDFGTFNPQNDGN